MIKKKKKKSTVVSVNYLWIILFTLLFDLVFFCRQNIQVWGQPLNTQCCIWRSILLSLLSITAIIILHYRYTVGGLIWDWSNLRYYTHRPKSFDRGFERKKELTKVFLINNAYPFWRAYYRWVACTWNMNLGRVELHLFTLFHLFSLCFLSGA
jgi:glucan phosphoethanolaminetransferase (alkaline phosphatase superfamily)